MPPPCGMRITTGQVSRPRVRFRMRAMWLAIWSSAGYRKPMNWISATGFRPCAAMPTDMPAIRPSASGVSCTRNAPKRSCRPTVARNTPPLMPTSSPSTTTSGSSASARASARLMPSTSVTLGMLRLVPRTAAIAARGGLLRGERGRWMCEQVCEQLVGTHGRAVLVGVHGFLDARAALRAQRGLVGIAPPALRAQPGAGAQQRLEFPGGFQFGSRPVAAGVVRGGVVTEPVGDRFDHHRAAAAAGARQRVFHHLAYGDDVVAIHLHAGHAI